jgi:O-acetyl-ADP-ribose deacetylase (regulator of RNase III)
MTRFSITQGDITKQQVDAIVNAANSSLLGGGGVDGAIHAAAGPQLLQECRTLGGCQTGQAKLTKGYNLPAKYVIHTVGPIYGNENGKEAELLAACYTNSLSLAKQYQCKTIAFPAISTGVYGFPKEEAVQIVKKTLEDFISGDDSLDEIKLVLYSVEDRRLYEKYFLMH